MDHLPAHLFTHFYSLFYINRAEKIAIDETIAPPLSTVQDD